MTHSHDDDPERFRHELDLIEAIQGGSTEHWHRFVERFSGLIYSVIRRQLFAEDEDDVRTVFADVLQTLYRGKLAEYEGRAELSTWLIVVSRGKALDFLRSRDGRRAMPAAYAEFTPFQQTVFRLYHAEGLPIEVVIDSLEHAGHTATAREVADAVLEIESRVDRHYLRRLESNARARSLGVTSGRLLDFLSEMRYRQSASENDRPDRVFDRNEARDRARRLGEMVSQLPEEEQKVLRLRYEHDWTARRISDELGLSGPRRVYTVLDRALQRLRNLFNDKE